VPPELRARHPDLPWREMIGIRHRLAHGYFATELFILHEVATVLLPPLLPRLRELAAGGGDAATGSKARCAPSRPQCALRLASLSSASAKRS
jgi:hypothetical protein